MSKVYVTTYEIVGEAISIADTFYAEVEAAKSAHWLFVEEVGGVGFRPNHNGGLRSVFFTALPKGWRKIGADRDKIEAVPHKGIAAGKALRERIAELPIAPQAHVLAEKLGYSPDGMAIDSHRGTIYFPTELRVAHPVKRAFIRLPRFQGDRFEPDEAVLRAVPESELMKAVEDHNAEAGRLRMADAGVTGEAGEPS